jgi:hypothetical protein
MKKVLVICVICLSLVIIWFRKGLIFAGGEGGIPFYNLELSTKLYPYAWRDVGTGYPGLGDLMSVPIFSFFALIAGLGVPGYLIQAGMFFLLLTTGTVSMYFLIKNTVGSELKNKNIPLIGAIFYLLNPYSMTQIWGRGLNIFSLCLTSAFSDIFYSGDQEEKCLICLFGFIIFLYFVSCVHEYRLRDFLVVPPIFVFTFLLIHLGKGKKG